MDYKSDNFYKTISSILSINNMIKPTGSFLLHKDYSKVCDIDLNEKMNSNNDFLTIFKQYIYRLMKEFKGHKIYFVKAYFNIIYQPIKNIKDKMGYIDGLMNIHNIFTNQNIDNDINILPLEIKNNILVYIEKYKETKNVNDYINILAYLNSMMYVKWTLEELYEGKKTYYNTIVDLNNSKFTYFYIEVIYDKIRVSNYINIINEMKYRDEYNTVYSDEIILAERLSYYRLLKKFKVFIKWLTYTYKIKDSIQKDYTMKLYDEIAKLIYDVSGLYNKCCNILNKIDIIKIKMLKNSNNDKMKRYTEKLKKYNTKYKNGIHKLEMKYKNKYLSYIENPLYKRYLQQYFRIV